jgi:Ca2+-binding RTX toxin-like protein
MGKRVPKLPVASAERIKVTISEDDWKRIEKAYGLKLSPEARRDIHEKTQDFVDHAGFAQNAEPASDARDRISAIAKAADSLRSTLNGGDHDADVYARTLIKKHLRAIKKHLRAIKKRDLLDGGASADTLNGVAENNTYVGDSAEDVVTENANEGIDTDGTLRAISSDMMLLIFASQDALKELNDTTDGGFKEGKAWARWVNELTDIAKARGLPWRVRKDSDNRIPPSPFVELVWELQKNAPYGRGHSQGAVAVAIISARRNRVG